MTKVSWDEAEKFCRALSKKLSRTVRLPYEEEWEYACRAGKTGPLAIWKGDLDRDLDKLKAGNTTQFRQSVAKVINCVSSAPVPVGNYPPNAWGLCDMHGNVWEWCKDYSSTVDNDAPGPLYRPLRGGSWVSRDWTECRSAKRAWELKEKKKDSIGFRVLVEMP
jgi:formylglycine-generating enzyme required for sulfatase activity